jgi:sensor domain CHASE-containing protein
MSLRSKTLAYVVLAIAALVGATLWVIDGVVMRELAQAEHEETSGKVADVHSVVQRCVKEYVDSFSDWTEWDDMAQFLADGNEAFLHSNVNVASLGEQIHAQCFIVERDDGTVVFATQIDLAGKELEPCSSEFLTHLTPRGLMRTGDSYGGLLALRDCTYVVSSRPIHKSDFTAGPVAGRLITAQRIDKWICIRCLQAGLQTGERYDHTG